MTTTSRGDAPADDQDRPATTNADDLDAEFVAAELAAADDRWRRAAADLDNFRKRSARELALARSSERAHAAATFLPVLDGLDDAAGYARDIQDALADGMRPIREQAISALERLGYPRIDEVGVPFDPRVHDVVSVVEEPDLPPRTVVAVARSGYGTPDGVLRPAAVVVTPTKD